MCLKQPMDENCELIARSGTDASEISPIKSSGGLSSPQTPNYRFVAICKE